MANILDGKLLSQTIRQELSKESKAFELLHGRVPGLAVLLIGENPASKIYVRNKKKACEDCGFYSEVLEFPKDVRQEEIAETICRLNGDDRIDGILIQLPLPDHIDKAALINIIDPQKDVDAFHSLNVGRLFIGQYLWAPCTPAGVMEMLHRAGISVAGKKCVVVGRSNLVGKPMGQLLLQENGTVTLCHSKTADLKKECLEADILVVAVGHPHLITADMVKQGAVVIDVGIDRDVEGKLCGDVDFERVKEKASYISPVPGGVGPMTVTMLMKNTLLAAENRCKNKR